jgi:2,4-dienoyl-CoA reductase (NADPH2)
MDEGADRSRRRFAVVGAGPAGLAAALDLAERGHRVTLFEAADALGGQFSLAARIPGKEDYARTPASALQRLQQLGAEIRTGVQATLETVSDFDGVVLATGVVPREVDIPGADLPHVLSYERAITAGVPAGTVAIIGGGGIGVDVAAYLVESHDPRERAAAFMSRFDLTCSSALLDERSTDNVATVVPRPGSTVTLLRRQGRFGHGVGITTRWVAIGALREAGVRMVSDVSYRAITAEGVEVEHPDGRVELIAGESVIVCAGQERHDPLAYALDGADIPFQVVGGARDARSVDAVRATTEGLEAARRLAQALGD